MSNDTIQLRGSLEIQAAAGKAPKVSIMAYGGGPMTVGGFNSPVVIDLAGLQLPPTVPLLADHVSTLDSVAGSGSPRTINGSLYVDGTLASTETGQRIVALSRDGVPLQASVGVNPGARSQINKGDSVQVNGRTIKAGERGLTVVKAGTLREVSILPLGADSTTTVSISAKGGNSMSTEVITTDNDAPDPVVVERKRVSAIHAAARQYLPTTRNRSEIQALCDRAIDEGWEAKDAELAMLRAARENSGGGSNINSGSGSISGRYNAKDALTAACMIMGGHGEKVVKHVRNGEQLANSIDRPSGYPELCALALRLEGLPVPHDRNELLKAGFSTTSLPNAIGSSIEKAALDVFMDMSKNWTGLARIVNATSFKAGKVVRLAANTKLEKVGKDGSLKHSSIGEDAYDYQLSTYGKMVTIDRQSLINDDLAVFSDLPAILGGEAARTASDLVFSTLAANTGTFFSAGHGNTTTGALTVTTLGAAITILRTRTDGDSRVIGFVPTTLLVPAALEGVARQLVQSQAVSRASTNDQVPTGNPWVDQINLAVEPRLDATSAVQWYLFAQPRHGAILVALLGGRYGVVVEQAPLGGSYLGYEYRAYMDMGVSLGEYRAAVRSTGS